jgi:hypothetical protein
MNCKSPEQQTANRQQPARRTGLVEAREAAKISPSIIFLLEKTGAC